MVSGAYKRRNSDDYESSHEELDNSDSSDSGQMMEARVTKTKSKSRSRHGRKKREVSTPWADSDCLKLLQLVQERLEPGGSDATVNWAEIAALLGNRNAKQCREKYRNDLRPDISKAPWSLEEDFVLALAHSQLGNRWCDVSQYLPRRAENTCKNRWYATLRAKADISAKRTFLWLYANMCAQSDASPTVFRRARERWEEMVAESNSTLPSLATFEVDIDYFTTGPGVQQNLVLQQAELTACMQAKGGGVLSATARAAALSGNTTTTTTTTRKARAASQSDSAPKQDAYVSSASKPSVSATVKAPALTQRQSLSGACAASLAEALVAALAPPPAAAAPAVSAGHGNIGFVKTAPSSTDKRGVNKRASRSSSQSLLPTPAIDAVPMEAGDPCLPDLSLSNDQALRPAVADKQEYLWQAVDRPALIDGLVASAWKAVEDQQEVQDIMLDDVDDTNHDAILAQHDKNAAELPDLPDLEDPATRQASVSASAHDQRHPAVSEGLNNANDIWQGFAEQAATGVFKPLDLAMRVDVETHLGVTSAFMPIDLTVRTQKLGQERALQPLTQHHDRSDDIVPQASAPQAQADATNPPHSLSTTGETEDATCVISCPDDLGMCMPDTAVKHTGIDLGCVFGDGVDMDGRSPFAAMAATAQAWPAPASPSRIMTASDEWIHSGPQMPSFSAWAAQQQQCGQPRIPPPHRKSHLGSGQGHHAQGAAGNQWEPRDTEMANDFDLFKDDMDHQDETKHSSQNHIDDADHVDDLIQELVNDAEWVTSGGTMLSLGSLHHHSAPQLRLSQGQEMLRPTAIAMAVPNSATAGHPPPGMRQFYSASEGGVMRTAPGVLSLASCSAPGHDQYGHGSSRADSRGNATMRYNNVAAAGFYSGTGPGPYSHRQLHSYAKQRPVKMARYSYDGYVPMNMQVDRSGLPLQPAMDAIIFSGRRQLSRVDEKMLASLPPPVPAQRVDQDTQRMDSGEMLQKSDDVLPTPNSMIAQTGVSRIPCNSAPPLFVVPNIPMSFSASMVPAQQTYGSDLMHGTFTYDSRLYSQGGVRSSKSYSGNDVFDQDRRDRDQATGHTQISKRGHAAKYPTVMNPASLQHNPYQYGGHSVAGYHMPPVYKMPAP